MNRDRLFRFLVVGAITTALSYGTFILALRVMSYVWGAALAWVVGLLAGFALNRRFTFGIRGSERRAGDFSLFAVGTLLQLGIAECGYWLFLDRLQWPTSAAFVVVLTLTTTFSFSFQSFVTFRRA